MSFVGKSNERKILVFDPVFETQNQNNLRPHQHDFYYTDCVRTLSISGVFARHTIRS